MAVALSNRTVIGKGELLELGARRLAEARLLLENSEFAGAVYLGGYAVECGLKAAICTTLDLEGLPAVFKSHDLDVLLFHSGLRNRLRANAAVARDFALILATWNVDRREEKLAGRTVVKGSVRYRRPGEFDLSAARELLRAVDGVVTWLRTMT